jgi:hypothetical protein
LLIGKWLENPDNGFGVANLFSVANTKRIQFTGKKWREDNVVNDPPLAVHSYYTTIIRNGYYSKEKNITWKRLVLEMLTVRCINMLRTSTGK